MDTGVLCFLRNSMQLLDDSIIAFLHGNILSNYTTHYNSIIQGTYKYNFEGILVTVEVLELCSCCSVYLYPIRTNIFLKSVLEIYVNLQHSASSILV